MVVCYPHDANKMHSVALSVSLSSSPCLLMPTVLFTSISLTQTLKCMKVLNLIQLSHVYHPMFIASMTICDSLAHSHFEAYSQILRMTLCGRSLRSIHCLSMIQALFNTTDIPVYLHANDVYEQYKVDNAIMHSTCPHNDPDYDAQLCATWLQCVPLSTLKHYFKHKNFHHTMHLLQTCWSIAFNRESLITTMIYCSSLLQQLFHRFLSLHWFQDWYQHYPT